MGDVELVGLLLDVVRARSRCTSGANGRLFDFARPLRGGARRSGSRGIGIWHADLEHVLETRTLREMKAILDGAGLKHLELEFLMDWFVDPGDERRAASDRQRRLLFDAAAVLEPHHIKVGNIPAHPCAARAGDRALRRAVRRRGRAARRARSPTSSCRSTRTCATSTTCARGRRGRRRAERRHRDRHLAHGQARHRARGAAAHPARAPRLGRAERRPVRGHARPGRRDDQPPPAARRGRVRRRAATSTVCATWATPGRGASRCSPRSCATCPSRRSSSGPTRRPAPSSARASGDTRGAAVTDTDSRPSSTGTGSIWMFTQMLRIREFEERVKRTFEEHPGVIRGHTHLADGAEASIVGSIAALRDGDQFMATYRCHGYPIALGSRPEGDDGRDLRQADGPVRRLRRLDAPRRRRARLPRHVGDRRPGHPAGDRRRLGRADPQARARSSSASSATARPSRARSTSR